MPQFHIRLAGDDLVFSAGHFITLADGQCERLHGHTYRVTAEIHGPLGVEHYVVDFVAVRMCCGASLPSWIIACYCPRCTQPFAFPRGREKSKLPLPSGVGFFQQDDCLLLPVANTTTELLAQYVGERLRAAMAAAGETPSVVRIEIGEGSGASAGCEI